MTWQSNYGIGSLDVAGLNYYPQGLAGLTPGGSMQGLPTTMMGVEGITPGLGDLSGSASSAAGSNLSQGLGGASIGLAIGNAIGGMYSAWKGGKTMEAVLKSQASIAEHNRQRGQMGAESAFRQGESQIAQITFRAGQLKAKQRTAYGANGVALGSGSAAEVAASTDIMKEIDVATTRMNALTAAWGYKNQAAQAGAQAVQFQGLSGYASAAGFGQAAGSLIEGGFDVAERWYKYFGG